jgi:hypothetical protein
MSEILITNSVTILIALIAGMVALHQVKLNVISAARVKWVEDLRETLSLYVCEIEIATNARLDLIDERKGKSGKDLEDVLDKFYNPYLNASKEVQKLQSKILLYLDSENTQHKKIEELLHLNSILVHKTPGDNRDEIRRNITEIVKISKSIFKVEWKKSKGLFKL